MGRSNQLLAELLVHLGGIEARGIRRERTDALEQDAEQPDPRRRGRHIPAAVRRTVFERDGNRCSYLDASGTR